MPPMTVGASGEKVKESDSGVPHWAGVTLPVTSRVPPERDPLSS